MYSYHYQERIRNLLRNQILLKILKNYSLLPLILVLNLYLYGYSYEEIAKNLGKNVKSVDNALSRVRKKIISRLGE